MYPPDRRARGMSYVLFGSVVGAVLGPFVFGPMFAGKHLTADDLVVPWLAAGAFLVVGLGIAFLVRPDPSTIAKQHGDAAVAPSPLKEILRRPGVPLAMLAAVASFAVMASVMNLSGYVAVDHGIAQGDVFRIISAHIVGMFGLVIVVGDLIDRMGRQRAITAGLTLMAASTFALVWFESIIGMSVALFGLGLGWSFSFVAATAELVTLAGVNERGRLIGFCDLVASLTAAVLVLIGGAAFTGLGTIGLAVGGTLMAVIPALVLLVFRRAPEPALELA
jgi:MFS family permease